MSNNSYGWGNTTRLGQQQSRPEERDVSGFAANNVGGGTHGVNGHWPPQQQMAHPQRYLPQHQAPIYHQQSSHLPQHHQHHHQHFLQHQSGHVAPSAAHSMTSGYHPLPSQDFTEFHVHPQHHQQQYLPDSAVNGLPHPRMGYANSAPPAPPPRAPYHPPRIQPPLSEAPAPPPPPLLPQHPLPSTAPSSQTSVGSAPAPQSPSESEEPVPPPPPPPPPAPPAQQSQGTEAAATSEYFSAEGQEMAKRPQKRPRREDIRLRSISDYILGKVLGSGTFGEVTQAVDRADKTKAALKFVKIGEKEKNGILVKDFGAGIPLTCLREMRLLKSLKHKNLVILKEVITGTDPMNFFMVLEYVDNDLAGLILEMEPHKFNNEAVKSLMGQFLEGLKYLHGERVMHRDLKCSNLLVTNTGVLKIADLGMARELMVHEPNSMYRMILTPNLCTQWYRAPEVLLKDPNYSTPSDMWSAGCIFSEMLFRTALLPGKDKDDADQLNRIFDMCGQPESTTEGWEKHYALKDFQYYRERQEKPQSRLKRYCEEKYIDRHPNAYSLLERMLTVPPSERITAQDARNHLYFSGWNGELPKDWDVYGSHEKAAKARKEQRRQADEQLRTNQLLLRRR